jgi:hypothetical protein
LAQISGPKAFTRPTWQRSPVPFVLQDESGQVTVAPDGLTLGSSPQSPYDLLPDDMLVKAVDDPEPNRRPRKRGIGGWKHGEWTRPGGLVKTVDEFEPNRRRRKRGVGGWTYEEWILPTGGEVYVRGALSRSLVDGAVLSRPPSGGFLLTMVPPEEERGRNELFLRLFTWVVPPVSLVFYYLFVLAVSL